jgi:hypothetical protein
MNLKEKIRRKLYALVDDLENVDESTDEILKIFKKQMKDLETEYKKRQMFELDQKVIFEDIRDILDGKTYGDIF